MLWLASFAPMYLFSSTDISLFNKKTERKCSSTTTSWGYQMLEWEKAMTAIKHTRARAKWLSKFLPVMPTKVNMEAATAAKMVAGLE